MTTTMLSSVNELKRWKEVQPRYVSAVIVGGYQWISPSWIAVES